MTPGFHFSTINHDMVSGNPATSLNLLWNQQLEAQKANASLFMTPNFDPSIGYTYPEFGTWGNNLLNPMLAIQQTMQSFQNGSWMNGGFGGFGNFNFPGFNNGNIWNNFQSPWNNSNAGNNSGSAADKLKQSQYDKLRKVLVEYQKTASDSEKAVISEALNKSGKIGEKLDALKAAAKKLKPSSIQDALLNMDSTKIELDTAGYKLKDSKAYTDLKQKLNNLEKDIKAKKSDLTTSTVCTSESDPNILKTLSYWNDTHNSDSNRNIIRLIADYLPTGSGEGTNQKASVNNIAQSLVNYVETVKSHFDSDIDFSKLDKSKQGVSDALSKCLENFNRANILALADKMDDLYARLRMIEAERIKNNLKREYGSLNKLLGKDVVTDSLVVKATENDLKAEGISIPSNRDAVPFKEENETVIREDDPEDETADEKIEKLTKSGEDKALKETTKKGVYQTDTVPAGENPKFYTKDEDDKLVELKDVKAIDRNGQCTMIDGSKKPLSEVEKVEVQKADVQAYNDEMKRVKDLVKNETIENCNITFQGRTLYKSKGTNTDGNKQYFIVVDGELKRLNCKFVVKGCKEVQVDDDNKVKAEDFNDFISISDSEIKTVDEHAEAEKERQKVNEEQQKEIDGLVKNKKIAPSNCKKPKIYRSYEKVGDNYVYYLFENGKIYKLEDVVLAYGNGNCKKANGDCYNIGNLEQIKRIECTKDDIGKDDEEDSEESKKYEPTDNGAELRKKLRRGTGDQEYKDAKSYLNKFANYTEADDIYNFLRAYREENSHDWGMAWNARICAQISTEGGFTKAEKEEYLRTIAKQTLKLMDALGKGHNSEDYKNMYYWAYKAGKDGHSWEKGGSWSFWNSERTGAANKMDDIICKLTDEYRDNLEKNNTQKIETEEQS